MSRVLSKFNYHEVFQTTATRSRLVPHISGVQLTRTWLDNGPVKLSSELS